MENTTNTENATNTAAAAEQINQNTATTGADGVAAENEQNTSDEKSILEKAQKLADGMLAKKMKDMPSKEELKAFKAYQESQKTDEQKRNEAFAAEKTAKETAEAKATALELKISAMEKGVKTEFVEDVITLANSKISEECDFSKAISDVIAKYPHFLGQNAPVATGVSTTSPQGGTTSGVEEYFKTLNPNIKL